MPVPAGIRRGFIPRPVIGTPGHHVPDAGGDGAVTARAGVIFHRIRAGDLAHMPLPVRGIL